MASQEVGATRLAPGTYSFATVTVDAYGNVTAASAGQVKTKTIAVITYAATVTPNANNGNIQRCTLTGNLTVAAPTNPVDGQQIIFEFLASGAARTVTLVTGSTGAFKFGDAPTPASTTGTTAVLAAVASGTTTRIGAIYRSATARWDVIAYSSGH
jgi:hypothetical protein